VKALRVIYLALGASTASLSVFIAVILHARGLSSQDIGLVSGTGALALFAAIAFWGHIGDRVLGRRTTLQLVVVIAIAIAIGIGLPIPPILVAILVVGFSCTHGGVLALADALTVNTLGSPDRQYGKIRLMASLSFAVVTIGVGFAVDRLGYPVTSLFYVFFGSCLVAAAFAAPPDRDSAARSSETRTPGTSARFGSIGTALRTQPRLLPVLATIAVMAAAMAASTTFLSLRLLALGGQPSDVALSFGISAFAEIPGMFLAARLSRRFGLRGVFCLSAIAYAAAFASWAVLMSPSAIVATRLLTGLAFAGITYSMVLTIGQLLPRTLQATGQALYQGTASGIASAGGNVVGGVLYGVLGAPALFLICSGLCVAGGLMALATLPTRVR
jgi:MFS transporter, PPP family, 3-phenylpropionic acid transporter